MRLSLMFYPIARLEATDLVSIAIINATDGRGGHMLSGQCGKVFLGLFLSAFTRDFVELACCS